MRDPWTSRAPASPPLFGREEIVEEVDRMLARAREGHGQGLLLSGANGGGKSYVLRALVARGADRGFRVLSGHALPDELPSPFSLVRDLLRSMEMDSPRASADSARTVSLPFVLAPFGADVNARSRTTTEVVPRTTAALDELERILAPVGPSALPRTGASREGLVGRVEEYFLTFAQDRPLFLSIDDLHLTDTSSLEFLRRVAIDLPETPAVLVATVGAGAEIPERNRAALEVLEHSPAFHSMPLRALTVPEVTEFVRWIFGGRDPDPHDVLRWHAQTDGNPLFIEQVVRSATGYGSTGEHGVPVEGQDVNAILAARVQTLGAVDRRVLTYAAVLSKEFHFSDLATVAGVEEERVTESLDRLVQIGLLREKGNEVYEFVTEVLRVSVYADLTETRRRILHQKAGQALETRGGVDDAELARQFYLGRDHDRAVKYSVAAAESASRAFAFETAVAHLARAVEAERQRPERDPRLELRLLTEEGRLLNEIGNPHRSEEVLNDAVQLARSHVDYRLELGRALGGLAHSRYLKAEYESAEALAQEAFLFLPSAGAARDLMAAHRVLGLVAWRRGKLAQAEKQQRAVLEIAEGEGTALEQGHALIDVANLLVFTPQVGGRYEAALELYARAATLFAEAGDLGGQARALMNRAVLYWEAGRTDEAFQEYPRAIEAAERARSPRWIGWCYFNLAQTQAEAGRTEEAKRSLERATRVLAPIGDQFADMDLILTQAMIDHVDRSFDAAEANYREALSRARNLRLPAETSEILFRQAQLAHDRGDDAVARERLVEAGKADVLDHRPDFAPRVTALEKALAQPPAEPSG